MRAENVLNSLQEHSAQSGYVYDRLYRNLFNRDFFLQAYQNIYASQGNMTAGTDGKTVDAVSLERIDRFIAALRDESYQPMPSRRTYIPKKNGKLRPLGIPSIDDKLVQEVVRMLLESIYENSFEDTSHGFQPDRSCHTALRMIQNRFTKGFFDNIDHNVMIGILRKRIKDECFLRHIRKFLNAGYMEDNQLHQSYSGTPQDGIISPILANIYTTKRRIIAQYRIGKDIGVRFMDKHGNERIRLLWRGSLARDPYPLGKEAGIIHKPKGILKKPSLGARLKANRCEWCGKDTSVLVMHQVRTLKELDESQPWAAFMKKIKRKTLVVCESCHAKIHSADCE